MEYMRERWREVLDQARKEYWKRKNWRSFCHGYLLGGSSWREQRVRVIGVDKNYFCSFKDNVSRHLLLFISLSMLLVSHLLA